MNVSSKEGFLCVGNLNHVLFHVLAMFVNFVCVHSLHDSHSQILRRWSLELAPFDFFPLHDNHSQSLSDPVKIVK